MDNASPFGYSWFLGLRSHWFYEFICKKDTGHRNVKQDQASGAGSQSSRTGIHRIRLIPHRWSSCIQRWSALHFPWPHHVVAPSPGRSG